MSTFFARVNGDDVELRCDPLEALAPVLRRELHLYGVREACGIGVCGSCAVLIDGELHSGCLFPAFRAEGRQVTTIEGLGTSNCLDPVQEAYVEQQAFQCSFCTPGFILATTALVAEMPEADADAIDEYFGGQLCRCGSYEFIRSAALAALGRVPTEDRTDATEATS